jgi:hypothetical protein
MRREDWVVSPESILHRGVLSGLVTIDEAMSDAGTFAAQLVAERLRDSWSEGEGYGSSDFTYTLQEFLSELGVKTDFVDGRLARI